ncbi:recombinase family protein [Pseudescherichia sp.]|uniref:recombinase family protein n=1 Tax=Pseudescherichia sp. TaxID=2055881 RepID=UPI0028A0D048|nr:recombinase family protein [Pseudescherichia sp.]
MRKCFIYHRVSSDQQVEGSGLRRQADLIESYLERTNLCAEMDDPTPVIIAESGGTSAFKGHNMLLSSCLGSWMQEVRLGMWDGSHLVYENGDRFSRQNPFTVVGYINDLVKHKISIHDVTMNIVINHKNSAMLPMVLMNAQRAYDESKFKSDRIRKGWAKKRENAFNNGTIVTNKRPKWIDIIDNKYVLNDKSRIVEEIFRLYQTGIGCPTIAKVLQAKGEEWQFDRPWRGESVHKILRNRRVTGVIFISEIIRDYDSTDNPVDQKRYEMEVYPPVINKEQFELVQKLLKERRPGSGRTNGGIITKRVKDEDGNFLTNENKKQIYINVDSGKDLIKSNIFSGLCRCALCGEPMYHNVIVSTRTPKKSTSSIKDEYRYIRCLGERDNLCTNKALRYETVEQYVIEHVKRLDFAKIVEPNIDNPEAELTRIKIEEEKNHIIEYQLGIERLRNAGKKIPFDALVELEESQTRLSDLEQLQLTYENTHVDTDELKNLDTAILYDIKNIELRSRIERELSKIVDSIILLRNERNYTITFKYRNTDLIKHVLMVEAKKEPVLLAGISIEKVGDMMVYSTPSFMIGHEEGTMPRFQVVKEQPLSQADYLILMNYVESIEDNNIVANWMRDNHNFLFS